MLLDGVVLEPKKLPEKRFKTGEIGSAETWGLKGRNNLRRKK
jgi:hypothetical protein